MKLRGRRGRRRRIAGVEARASTFSLQIYEASASGMKEEEGFSLWGREFFLTRGGGNSRSPRDSWATKKKKKTFHYHWNDVCVCGTHFAQPKFNSCVVFKNAALPGAAASTLPGERGARNSWRRS